MKKPKGGIIAIKIEPYEAHEAARTIARAHEHLKNKPLMKAVKKHVDTLNQAVSGGMRPKQPKPSKSAGPWGGR